MLKVVVAGGGTAGHIEPALAVADALRTQHQATVWAVGTPKGLESDLVPARGYPLEMIDPVPVPRKPNMDLLKLPYRVLRAVGQARTILKTTQADAVIGFGGYVSAPVYIAAALQRVPFYVHESNARAGMANKLGVKLGGTGLNAVANSGIPGEVVGVPIRAQLVEQDAQAQAAKKAQAYEFFGLDPQKQTLLVTGGSQGARSINTAVLAAQEQLTSQGMQILHAVGKKNELPQATETYHPVPYIDRMDLALAVADVVVCRSGAMTVAEVTAAAVPAIYVPLPHGNGEQALNALPVVEAKGAFLLDDADLSAEQLNKLVPEALANAIAMQEAARASGVGDAAAVIAQTIADRVNGSSK